MRLTAPFRPLVLLLALCLLAPPIAWAEGPVVELPLASGDVLKGTIAGANAKEVRLQLAPNRIRRIPWAQLSPLGVYRVRAAMAPPADGEARKGLAEMAADLGLYKEARVEYEKALALGAITNKEFDTLVRGAERHAVKSGVERARHQAEAGDLEGALGTATQLRMHFASAPNARESNQLVDDLLRLVKKLDRESAKDRADLEAALVDVHKNKEILKRRTEALKLLTSGNAAAEKSAVARKGGNLTRARKNGEKAHESFQKARRNYGRLRRILPRGSDLRKEVLEKLVELDKAQFDLLYEMAWFLFQSKVYRQAETWAARASYIDPVHPDLMELREELVGSRIRYRLSDMTNARGIVR